MKKKILIGLFLTGFLTGNTVTAYAAPEPMPDGTLFDAVYYAQAYPDVAAALGTNADALYNHYITHGRVEGRLPVAPAQTNAEATNAFVFDAIYYAQAYPDVAAAVGTDADALYSHYITYGRAEGRFPVNPGANQASVSRTASVLGSSVTGINPYAGKTVTIPGSNLAVDALTYPDGFSMALGNGKILQYNSSSGINGGYVTAAVSERKLVICYDFLTSTDGIEFHRLPSNTEYLFFIRDANTGKTVGIFQNTANNSVFSFPGNNGSQTFHVDDAGQVWLVSGGNSPLPNGSYFITVSTASTNSLVASNIFTVSR